MKVKYDSILNQIREDDTTGAQGEPGVGVPAGGTADQVLAKVSDTDYDTQWVDQTGGGVSEATVIAYSIALS